MTFMALLEELRKAVSRDSRVHAVIANDAKIHLKTFSAFMNKRRGLSIKTIEKLAKTLKYEVQLVRMDPHPTKHRKRGGST
jgi:hypothetical protein